MIEKELTEQIIGAAIEVHKHWGPGLYEDIYDKSLRCELGLGDIAYESQVELPLVYKDEKVGDSLRLDLFVEKTVVVEIKTVAELSPVHEAQLLTYMKLTSAKVGLLINFNVPVLAKGVRRFVL
jgi:GxxExxY protein